MSTLTGLTKENCANECNVGGCAITGLPRCGHPCKGGLPLSHQADPIAMAAFDSACTAIGVANSHRIGENT